MSDREFGGNDDLSLPKATVDKIVKEILQNEPGMTFGKDTRDLLIECCVEFLTLVSSESNEIAEKDAKKTIGYEHVKQALEDLGFGDMVPHIAKVAAEFKDTQAKRERKQTKIEQSGMTEEELVRVQQELFRSATEKFNAGPQESTEGS